MSKIGQVRSHEHGSNKWQLFFRKSNKLITFSFVRRLTAPLSFSIFPLRLLQCQRKKSTRLQSCLAQSEVFLRIHPSEMGDKPTRYRASMLQVPSLHKQGAYSNVLPRHHV